MKEELERANNYERIFSRSYKSNKKAVDEESAEEIAENMEDNDYEEIEDVRVVDSRELDADDEDSYREYLEEEDEEEEW